MAEFLSKENLLDELLNLFKDALFKNASYLK